MKTYRDIWGVTWHEIAEGGDHVRVAVVQTAPSGVSLRWQWGRPVVLEHPGNPAAGIPPWRSGDIDWRDDVNVAPIADELRAAVAPFVRGKLTEQTVLSVGACAIRVVQRLADQGRLRWLEPS